MAERPDKIATVGKKARKKNMISRSATHIAWELMQPELGWTMARKAHIVRKVSTKGHAETCRREK